uniref:Uncharacterized protein n=1 Tax=Cucumis sativus TaxID=3659 RepID=A0A0A0LPC7_CUCSA
MAKILPLIFLLVVATIGFSNGHEVGIYELKRGDFSIQLTNYGATILSLILSDKNGKLDDVILSFPSVDDFRQIELEELNLVSMVFSTNSRSSCLSQSGSTLKINPIVSLSSCLSQSGSTLNINPIVSRLCLDLSYGYHYCAMNSCIIID